MFNFLKNALNNASVVQAPAPAPVKAKALRKAKAPKDVSDIAKARETRMAGWSLSGLDKEATEAFGPSFEADIHALLQKEQGAKQAGRALARKLNVMLSREGDNAHWSETTDEKRKAQIKSVRDRYVKKYIEVRTLQDGVEPNGGTARKSWGNLVGYAKEEAGFAPKTNETGTGNAKDYADFAYDNAVMAFKRGYKAPNRQAGDTLTTVMEQYADIIRTLKGDNAVKAIVREIEAQKAKGKATKATKADPQAPRRKPRATKAKA